MHSFHIVFKTANVEVWMARRINIDPLAIVRYGFEVFQVVLGSESCSSGIVLTPTFNSSQS